MDCNEDEAFCCLAGWRLRVEQEGKSVECGEGQGGLEGTGQNQDGVDEGSRALGGLDGTWRVERAREVCRTRGQRYDARARSRPGRVLKLK